MRPLASLLLLVALLVPAAAPAATEADAYAQARLDYFALRKDEKRRPFRHHWMQVIRGLDRGAEKLRGDDRCGALFNAGRAWHDVSEISYLQDDREEAIKRYLRLVDLCPKSSLADDALFHAAELQQKRDPAGARRTLDRLLATWAKGDRAAEARALRATLPAPKETRQAAAPAAKAKGTTAVGAAASQKGGAAAQPKGESGSVASAARPTNEAPAQAQNEAAAARPATDAGSAAPRSAAATAGSATGGPAHPHGTTSAAASASGEAPPLHAAEGEAIPGANLPSAIDILAALDARGADAQRPEDVALAEDLRRDQLAREGATPPPAGAKAAPAAAKGAEPEIDRERLAALEKATGGEVSLSLAAGLKVRRVVIDPGHGGKDTGAIGRKGTREKDLTLAISKKLKRELQAMGLEVLLTREKDVFLELEERTRFANERQADLFISVHINAAENRKAHGIETYTLNLNSDRYAMRLAARENASSKRRVADLEFILADLATKANTDDSVRLARLVQGEMVSRLRRTYGEKAIRDLGVKQALFFVLVGAKMPAILVEASFVSNPEEEQRLRTDKYQEETARSIAEGVRRFIAEREAIAQGAAPGSVGAVF